uniref:Transposase Tc1-like domain-containing protein n=1 Tax=Micrurus paraensis TaxID=1970185 RepID=A0A2D4KPV1_9SAUR
MSLLHKLDLQVYGRHPRRTILLSRKNFRARLKFAHEHLVKVQHVWNNMLWRDEAKIDLFINSTSRNVWQKPETAFYQKNLIPEIRHGVGNVIVPTALLHKGLDSSLYQRA